MNLIKQSILVGAVAISALASNAYAYNNALSDTMIQFDIITGTDKDAPDENNIANNFYILNSGISQPKYSIVFNNTGFTFNLLGSGAANEPYTTFDGFRITSLDGSVFTDFSIVSNTAFSNLPETSFDVQHLYVNYNNLSFNPGSVVFSVKNVSAPVPEPGTYAFLMTGLGLIWLSKKYLHRCNVLNLAQINA